jgi:SAM-dependent MidA family methyltransferase
VAKQAADAGLQVWGPVTQRDALLALGYRLWESGALKRQTESDPGTATRVFEERSRASILVDPAKLGGLYLLAMGTEDLPAPAAVGND